MCKVSIWQMRLLLWAGSSVLEQASPVTIRLPVNIHLHKLNIHIHRSLVQILKLIYLSSKQCYNNFTMVSTLFIRNIRKVCFETTSTSTITVLFRLGFTILFLIFTSMHLLMKLWNYVKKFILFPLNVLLFSRTKLSFTKY